MPFNDIDARLMWHVMTELTLGDVDPDVAFCTGILAGLRLATRHPEWAMAVMQLTGSPEDPESDAALLEAMAIDGLVVEELRP